MRRMVDAARECGYLKDIPPIRRRARGRLPAARQGALLCTGSQGEPRAALAADRRRQAPARARSSAGDTAIFSSRVIPGNEMPIHNLHNQLIRARHRGDHRARPLRSTSPAIPAATSWRRCTAGSGRRSRCRSTARRATCTSTQRSRAAAGAADGRARNGDMLRLAPASRRGDRRGAGRPAGARRDGWSAPATTCSAPAAAADEPRHDPGELVLDDHGSGWRPAASPPARLRARAVRRAAPTRDRRRGRGLLRRSRAAVRR